MDMGTWVNDIDPAYGPVLEAAADAALGEYGKPEPQLADADGVIYFVVSDTWCRRRGKIPADNWPMMERRDGSIVYVFRAPVRRYGMGKGDALWQAKIPLWRLVDGEVRVDKSENWRI